MRAESCTKPKAIALEKCGELAEIIFCENITKETRDGETFYAYDEYRTNAAYRDNLIDCVEKYRGEWLIRAKDENTREPIEESNPIDEVRGIAEEAKAVAQDTADILNEFLTGLEGD